MNPLRLVSPSTVYPISYVSSTHYPISFVRDSRRVLTSEIKTLLTRPTAPDLAISPISSIPSLPSPGMTTPPEISFGTNIYPFSTIPSPTLNPIMSSTNPLDTALIALHLKQNLLEVKSGKTRRPSLRVMTKLPFVSVGSLRSSDLEVVDEKSEFVKVQDGEEDDAGPGW